MRRLAVLTFVTLDGVMQAPGSPDEDPSGGFAQGGWAVPFWGGVMEQVQREAMATPYDLLLGRKTYESFAGHWPQVQDDPVADRLNAARKYVVSSGAPALTWTPSRLVTGEVPREIARLKDQDGPLLQVHGSARLIQTLLAHDLIDAFRLWHFPVLVGSGKRLFAGGYGPGRLRLKRSDQGSNGVLMTIYERD
ncbi:MAG: dihydrofolate reductase family protein [Rhodospirillales bacterium]